MGSDRGQGGALILGGRLFGSPLVNGALSESDAVMDIDGTALAGVVVVGDTFTLAGESGGPTHTVTGGPFYVGMRSVENIAFTPAIVAGGVADNAAVTFADNEVAEIRSWTIDNAGLEMIEDTVKGDVAKTFRGGLMGWEGSASAWLDYDDAQQAELIDAIATGSPNGTLAGLLFQIAETHFIFIYGGAELTNFVAGSPENGLVPVAFTFKGSGEVFTFLEGAFDSFTDSNRNLSAHTPDFGFGGWTYSGAANEWTITSNKALKTLTDNNTQFCRCNNDLVDDNFDLFADFTLTTGGSFQDERDGLYLLGHKSTAIANGEGVEVTFHQNSASPVFNLLLVRRDSAGAEQQNVTLATGLNLSTPIRIGATVSGVTVQVWTEPEGGGARTNRGSAVTLTVDLRDGDHKRMGLTGRSESNAPRSKFDDLTLILNR